MKVLFTYQIVVESDVITDKNNVIHPQEFVNVADRVADALGASFTQVQVYDQNEKRIR